MNKINLPQKTWIVPQTADTAGEVNITPKSWVASDSKSSDQKVVKMEPKTWAAIESPRTRSNPVNLSSKSWEASSKDPTPDQPPVKRSQTQYGDVSVLPPKVMREFKGESQLDAFNIPHQFAVRTKNLTGAGYPSLVTRSGHTLLGASIAGAGRILGLTAWKDSEIHLVTNGSWYKWTGSAWSNLKTGLNSAAQWHFTNFIGNYADVALIATNGVDAPQLYKGTTVGALPNAPAGLNYIAQHNNRLYGAVGNTVNFSALRKAEDWSTVNEAGAIVVESTDGQTINGLRAGDRHLLVFKPSSVYELWGNGPSSYELQIVADDIGLLNNRCSTIVNGMVYWMDANGVYMYGGSRPRKDFSLPVESYIKGMNKAQAAKASMGSKGNTLYVTIPYGTETEAQTTLEFDTTSNTWYVWRGIEPTVYAQVNGTMYIGNTSGRVMKIDGSATDNGTGIDWEWVSGPLTGESTTQKIKLYRMWYNADIPSGSTMNIYLSKDAAGDASWVLVKALTSADPDQGRFAVPYDSGYVNASWLRIRITGTGPMKLTEMNYQERELPMY